MVETAQRLMYPDGDAPPPPAADPPTTSTATAASPMVITQSKRFISLLTVTTHADFFHCRRWSQRQRPLGENEDGMTKMRMDIVRPNGVKCSLEPQCRAGWGRGGGARGYLSGYVTLLCVHC